MFFFTLKEDGAWYIARNVSRALASRTASSKADSGVSVMRAAIAIRFPFVAKVLQSSGRH